jgi:excisionase family DNA binding protein
VKSSGSRVAPLTGARTSDSVFESAFVGLVDAVAQRAAEVVLERLEMRPASPYMSVGEAADYLRCSKQRIYDLLSSGRLTRLKDGSRVLLRRSELDEHVSAGPKDVARALPRPSRIGSISGVPA